MHRARYEGGVWIGTFFDGIYYYNQRKNHFANIKNIPGTNSLSNNIIGYINEDAEGNLWIGTNGGLHQYNRHTARFSLYNNDNGLQSNDIKALYIDNGDNTIYIGSQLGGLGILKPNGSIASVRMNSHTADDNSIYAIRKLDDHRLLLGTLTGPKLFDKRNATISALPRDIRGNYTFPQRIRVLTTDHAGRLWIGGEDGVAVYTIHGGQLRRLTLPSVFKELGTACVFTMFEDNAHRVWIGTSQGLYCAYLHSGKLKTFTTADGLPSNAVYGILQDNMHRLWFSTGHGICSYTPNGNAFKYYTTKDGLSDNLFMPNAAHRTADGTLMFGSISGITSFAPETFHDNPFTPKALITELRLFDKRVLPGDDTGILNEQIGQTTSITLNHKQTVISLRLAVPNYLSGTHNTFAYKLEGYDNTWRHASDWQTINYSYLPAGTYRFTVMVANNDGKWNPTPTELQIKVLPPWYATMTAKFVYTLIFIALPYAVFRFFIEREREKQRAIQEHNEQQQRQEMYEMRQRFFIDISHELRTPLTLISSPLEEIMATRTDKAGKHHIDYTWRLQVGADNYIPKPFSLMVVKTKIYNILRTRRQMIAGYRKAKTVEPPKITVNSLDEEWVQKAIDVVNGHIDDEKFSTDDFAQCMTMSRTSLYMKMRALTGESVKEFIRRIRMNKAAELIGQGQLTIAEISYQVGFATPSYFTTSFKKFFGCLPTEYADRQKDE